MELAGLIIFVLLGLSHDAFTYPQKDLTAYFDTIPEHCVPGSTFKYKCNTCFCSSEGELLGCTLIACYDYDPLQNRHYNIEKEFGSNKIQEPRPTFRKRDLISSQHRKKRAADNIYDDDQQSFIDENPAPRSFGQQQQLVQQSYLQQQQAYYDQLQLQRDLEQERADLEEQLAELEAQQDEMEAELEYQQDQDAQQRAEDLKQQELDRQQQLLEQQQRQIEQQAQQKQDEQFYKNYKGFRKYPSRNFRRQ